MVILIATIAATGVATNPLQAQCEVRPLSSTGLVGDVEFGFAVDIDGETAVAGAPKDATRGPDAGAVYVSRRTGVEWSSPVRLLANDGAAFDSFGTSVSVHGNFVAVGAPAVDDAAANGGAVYIFERISSNWVRRAKLVPVTAQEDDEFGLSVAIHGDVFVTGARTDEAGTSSGSAFVYRRSGSNWIPEAQLIASDAALGDQFGLSVSISGNLIAVGARHNDDLGFDSGSAYIFRKGSAGWIQEAHLHASDGAAGDEFGISVAIDGDYVIVGARLADKGTEPNAGAAYVFRWNGGGWVQEAKLSPSDAAAGDQFGIAVGISGSHAVVGAWQDANAGRNTGAAYLFERKGLFWTERGKLMPPVPAALDEFGFSVAFGGFFAIAGVPGDDGEGTRSGSARVFGAAGDCNRNGSPDVCDILEGTALDHNNDGIPDDCPGRGDFTLDGEVDLRDFAMLQNCFKGSATLFAPPCVICDVEPDDDVDLMDFKQFQAMFSSP